MSFLTILKDVFTKINQSFKKITDNIFLKKRNIINYDGIQIYHHQDFSCIFVDISMYNLLSETEFLQILDYIIESTELHLNRKNTLINIITKIILKDDIGIIYTHSLTYKKLFTLENIKDWIKLANKDTKELLDHYKHSTIQNIEFRFDYAYV